MIGQWELSTTERSKTCVVTLKGNSTPQGLKLELEPGCAAALPFTKDYHGLEYQGTGYRAAAGCGRPAGDRFYRSRERDFRRPAPGEGIYILQNLAAARSLAKSMDQMIGDWAMVRGNGQSICGLTLTNTEATADNFQVFLKPRCDPAVAAFAPTLWRLERGELLLMSDNGEVWHFEADDNAQWRRVPDSRRSADHAAAIGPTAGWPSRNLLGAFRVLPVPVFDQMDWSNCRAEKKRACNRH